MVEPLPNDIIQKRRVYDPKDPKLTLKNKKFCEFYNDFTSLETYGNGTKSAIAAGYRAKFASDLACSLLKKQPIIDYINELQELTKAQTNLNREDYVKILMSKASTVKNEGVQARYWEMIGRAKGFIEPEDKGSQTIALFQQLDSKIGQRLQMLNNTEPQQLQQVTINTPIEAEISTLHNTETT